jgi:hypothetical protein
MGEPLKHHYIPRFYLSAWCGRDGCVTYYKVERDGVVAKRISPKGTGYEDRLYTLKAGPEDLRRLIEENRDSGRETSKSLEELFQNYLDSSMTGCPVPTTVRNELHFGNRQPRKQGAEQDSDWGYFRFDPPRATRLDKVPDVAPAKKS